MKFIKILLISLVFLGGNILYAEKWPTTKFEIVYLVPSAGKKFHLLTEINSMSFSTLISMGKTITESPIRYKVTSSEINKLEIYLAKVALKYQSLGFKAPILDDLKKGKYRIYMFDYDDEEATAAYNPPGDGRRAYIRLDLSRIMEETGMIASKVYDDLAHELFHAIQANYPLFQNQDIGFWIQEGTANFMGHEMAKLSFTKLPPQVRWGARVYSEPLYVKEDTTSNDYWTSSLWQYIGESIARSTASQALSSDTRTYIEPNYTYLIDFFDIKLGAKASEKVELDWLEARLSLHPKIGKHLNQVYSEFITSLVHYMPKRKDENITEEEWRTCLFKKDIDCNVPTSDLETALSESCPLIGVSRGKVTTHKFSLNKVASRCFELHVNGELTAPDIFLRIRGNDEEKLKSLWIGTGKGKNREVSSSTINSVDGVDGFFTEWKFPIMEKPHIFTIMNVAEKPSDTLKQDITLEMSFTSFSTTLVPPTANGAN